MSKDETKHTPVADAADYQKRVLARASNQFHDGIVPLSEMQNALREFIKWGNVLDRVKKSLFYGKPFYLFDVQFLPGERPDFVSKPETSKEEVLLHAILGHLTESVELAEALVLYQAGAGFDDVNLQEEFGDGNWYRTLALSELGQTDLQNMDQNDCKLEKRFGAAFSKEKATNRDLDKERQTLEGK